MPNKMRIVQKEWVVLTKAYSNFKDAPIVASNVMASSPCPPCNSPCPSYLPVVNGDKAWTEYKRSTSFVEIRKAIRELLYNVGLKRDDIQVVELVNHDYIITPLN